MFYAQCDNKGSMYKLAVKVIDDVNSASLDELDNNISERSLFYF
jgi:hypothetical protein